MAVSHSRMEEEEEEGEGEATCHMHLIGRILSRPISTLDSSLLHNGAFHPLRRLGGFLLRGWGRLLTIMDRNPLRSTATVPKMDMHPAAEEGDTAVPHPRLPETSTRPLGIMTRAITILEAVSMAPMVGISPGTTVPPVVAGAVETTGEINNTVDVEDTTRAAVVVAVVVVVVMAGTNPDIFNCLTCTVLLDGFGWQK